MGGYEREEELEDEYYADYVDEEDQEGGEEYEYEEEEEEERSQPTKEELEYLELRERLKESIRKQMKREHGSSSSSSSNKRQKLPFDNYGSFFGPSKPVIAQRVIQESKSLLENHHMASKISNVQNSNKKTSTSTSTAAGSKPRAHEQISRVKNELKSKVQKLKDTRDYSFLLSDDVVTSAPGQDPRWQNGSSSTSESRSGGLAQMQMNRKQPFDNGGRHINNAREERRPVSSNGQMHSKAIPKLTSASRLGSTSVDPRRQPGGKSGNGPSQPAGPKGLPLKKPVANMEKVSSPGMRNTAPSLHKPSSSKFPSSAPKQYMEHTRGRQEPNKGKIVPKQPVASSRSQPNKPPLRPNPPPRAMMQDSRLKKPVRRHMDDSDDPESALAMIRNMFKYDPNKYAGDDEDDSDMEANFDDILREEKRSARIARKEDEEELRKIEEEERREMLAKKRRKMAH